jgi:hypothetical protein
MAAAPEQANALYIDDHVRVYYGQQTRLPKHYVVPARKPHFSPASCLIFKHPLKKCNEIKHSQMLPIAFLEGMAPKARFLPVTCH